MPIIKQKDWDKQVKNNTDPYGKADDAIDTGGITGFMAGCVAQMVSHCHSRGNEFLSAWNGDVQCNDEGKKATKKGVALNPALLTISK